MLLRFIIVLSLLLKLSLFSYSQPQVGNTVLDTLVLASNLDTPWDLHYTSDSSLWFTERTGKVSRIELNTNQVKVVLDYTDTVVQFGEGGLLGMAILETTAVPKVYLVYNYRTSNSTYFERLVRFDYDMSQDSLINESILLDSIPAAVNHNGSRLEIVNNHIFMTTGDAINTSLPQDTASLAGKVLRLELNGSIPTDNPIANSPIYSWGHRNAQGLTYANGFLYSSEHGPNSDDEINIIEKGRNYGWPDVKGFCNTSAEIIFCNDSNVVEPLFAWTPTVATSGICYYNHPSIPDWEGNLLLTTLKNQRVINLELNSTKDSILRTSEHFTNRWGRLRDITSSPDGAVFIATNGRPSKIIKLWNSTYTSLTENKSDENGFKMYPNPAIDKLVIDFQKNPSGVNEIRVFDIDGKQVKLVSSNSKVVSIDISSMTKGIFLLEVRKSNGNREVKKILIK